MPPEAGAERRRLAKFMPLENEPACLDAMQEALSTIPSGDCVLLSSTDGQRLAFVAPQDVNASRLAAIVGSLCGLGETLGRELNQSGFRDVIIQTETGVAVVQRIPHPSNRLVLRAAAGRQANMGIVSSHTRYCASAIAALCFPARLE